MYEVLGTCSYNLNLLAIATYFLDCKHRHIFWLSLVSTRNNVWECEQETDFGDCVCTNSTYNFCKYLFGYAR